MARRKPVTRINKAHYLEIKKRLLARRWVVQKKNESIFFKAPRDVEGKEETLRYDPDNGPRVGLLHTSWLEKEDKWRDVGEDSIWPLIVQGKKVVWFGRPCQRTERGIVEVFLYSLIIEHEIDNPPACSICNQIMPIKRTYGTRDYNYVCARNQYHPTKTVILPFGFSLDQPLRDFLKAKDEASERYRERNEREGKNPRLAATIRKPWGIEEEELPVEC